MSERLQKYLARAGVASRRKSEELILTGRIRVNGSIVDTLGTSIDPDRDVVEYDGKAVQVALKLVWLLLNKPAGVVTTVTDPRGRPTVTELVPAHYGRLFPVGRLDADSQGLLLITNDGELAFRLTHPRFGIVKKYEVEIVGRFSASATEQLVNGVMLDDGWARAGEVSWRRLPGDRSLVSITVQEGRKRMVRRMLKAVGHPVLKLTRTELDGLALDDLPVGSWRMLSCSEVNRLRSQVGLDTIESE